MPYIQKSVILLSKRPSRRGNPASQDRCRLSGPRSDAYNVLGAAYAQKGEYGRALAEFRAAYGFGPGFPGVGDNIANALIDLHDCDGAARFCAKNSKLGLPCAKETLERIRAR